MTVRIITLFFCLIKIQVFAQCNADSLLQFEWIYYSEKSEQARNLLLLEKTYYSISEGCLDQETMKDLSRINESFLSHENMIVYRWNKALVAYFTDEYAIAQSSIEKYNTYGGDQSVAYWLLYYQIAEANHLPVNTFQLDSIMAIHPDLEGLKCLFAIDSIQVGRNKNYMIASAIFPGLGMYLQKEWTKGITATLLNGASTLAAISLWQRKMPINAILFSLIALQKIYLGNIILTGELSSQHKIKARSDQANLCSEKWRKALDTYPINPLKPII